MKGKMFFILLLLLMATQANANMKKNECVSGDCINGRGTYILTDGRKYAGSFKDGKYNGNGTLSSPNGTTYTGTFKEGIPSGHGSFTLPNGDSYTGACKNSIPHGHGTYTFVDGTTFTGEFVNGLLNGQGIALFSNGDKYVGEFKNNTFHGQGTTTLANGESHTGLFRDNKLIQDGQDEDSKKDVKLDMESVFANARKFYSNAPDTEKDEYMAEHAKAMSAVLPTKLNEGTNLYRIWYDAKTNTLAYAYEMNATNLGMSEQELLGRADVVNTNMRRHHVNYFCTFPSSKLFLDIGINLTVAIMTTEQRFLTGYTLTIDDCETASLPANIDNALAAYQRKDYKTALKQLRTLANQGNTTAQTKLGYMYDNGLGVKQNHTVAADWYQQAVKQGNIDAHFYLGLLYDEGKGVEQNNEMAAKLFLKVAEAGNHVAQSFLGSMYAKGQGVEQNDHKAFYWHKRAADNGNMVSLAEVGTMYISGKGVTMDHTKAAKILTEAAKHGDYLASMNLAWLYKKGYGVKQDFKKAGSLYKNVCDDGGGKGCTKLGDFYEYGECGYPQF